MNDDGCVVLVLQAMKTCWICFVYYIIWHDDVYDCNDDGFSGAIMMLGKECNI